MKNVISAILLILVILIGHSEYLNAEEIVIPTKGITADGKYPVYYLDGGLDDINYFTGDGEYVFRSGELLGRLIFIEEQDVGKGYDCEYICKDKKGGIVGINPSYKALWNK